MIFWSIVVLKVPLNPSQPLAVTYSLILLNQQKKFICCVLSNILARRKWHGPALAI